ncbi:MAG: glycosyltransferase [Coriobacteriia bacterium]
MRVTMLNKYYAPHLGGIEHHMRDLALGLHARGVEVSAIVANEGRELVDELYEGIPVTRLPRAFAYASTPVAAAVRSTLRARENTAEPPDIVHLHSPYPWGEISWLSADMSTPSVLTYHSDIVRQRFLGAAYRPWLDRVLDAADLIIAGSPNMVENSAALSARAEKCRVVPYGIEVERFDDTPRTRDRATALRAFHSRPIVLFVGRLVYYKGVDILLKAAEHVDADVVLIGSGPLEAPLREWVAAHGMAERVKFLGPQPDAELAAWYRAADVFCLPSVARSEAFGLVQIEAQASGTPVISTDLPTGVPFANLDGVTGLTVPVGDVPATQDALSRMLGDDELRARLAAGALERSRRDFTVARMVDQTLEVYREAIQVRGGRA